MYLNERYMICDLVHGMCDIQCLMYDGRNHGLYQQIYLVRRFPRTYNTLRYRCVCSDAYVQCVIFDV